MPVLARPASPVRPARLARLAAALLVAVASVVLLGSSPAHACKCVFGDVGRQVERADAVFVGSFDRADRTVAEGQISFDLAVDEVYRGQVSSELTVRAPYSSATCGLDGIPAGEPVAWFVRSAPDGEVRSDLCTGTTPLRPQLARRLERLAGPPGPPVTSGPLVEAGGGIQAPGSGPGPTDPTESAGPDGSTGSAGVEDSTGAEGSTSAEDTGGLFDGGLPWWAWTAIMASIALVLTVIVARTVRRALRRTP